MALRRMSSSLDRLSLERIAAATSPKRNSSILSSPTMKNISQPRSTPNVQIDGDKQSDYRFVRYLTNKRAPQPKQCPVYFTKNHEWVQLIDTTNNIARVGVSDFRSVISGDFIRIALDQFDVQDKLFSGDELCEIDTTTDFLESFRMPVSGKVTKVNSVLLDFSPLLANRSPENEGWLAEIEIDGEEQFSDLMTRDEYNDYLSCEDGKMKAKEGERCEW